ncbi:MAG TPA: Uma2 family endonuclease [Acidimicrobiales bacterium]|nr:Uma2 family endonuclease [Acidimicrobiales bacterium]
MAVQPAPYRFTVGEYYRMAEAGIFDEDDRVELLEGEIVDMAPIGSRHAACVKRLNRFFSERLPEQVTVAVQDPVRLSEVSESQPDLMLLHPRSDDYAGGHPGPEDVLLLIEVADTTAAWDREHKLPLYARAGVREVWLVDLPAGTVEVCRRPEGAVYQSVRLAGPDERLAPEAFPETSLLAGEVLV